MEAQVVFGGGAYLQLLFQRGAIEHAGEVLGTPREARLTTEFKLHLLVRNPPTGFFVFLPRSRALRLGLTVGACLCGPRGNRSRGST